MHEASGDPGALQAAGVVTPVVQRRWPALAFLSALYALNYADRQIVSVLAEPIKNEMALSDSQLSLITGTLFGLFYSVLSLPIAHWADRSPRVRIIAAACFIWSLFTGLTGLVSNLMQLAIARIGVAVGEAGGAAPSLSLIGDYFQGRERVSAVSLFAAAGPVGMLLGTVGAGLVAAAYGWRAALLCLAAIGLTATPLFLMIVREPRRERLGSSTDPAPPQPFLATLSLYIKRPSLRWLMLAAALYSCAGNSALSWMPALLIRQYGADLSDVAIFYGPVVALSLFFSAILSGLLLARLLKRSFRAYALLPAGAMLLCGPLFVIALSFDDWRVVIAALFIPFLLVNAMTAPALSLIQELTPSTSRATAVSLLMLVLNLVGLGLGPLLVGIVSDALLPSFGQERLFWALAVLFPIEAALCALCLYFCSRHLIADRAKVHLGGNEH